MYHHAFWGKKIKHPHTPSITLISLSFYNMKWALLSTVIYLCQNISKLSKMLSQYHLARPLKLYIAVVQLHLKFLSSVWKTHLVQNIDRLETPSDTHHTLQLFYPRFGFIKALTFTDLVNTYKINNYFTNNPQYLFDFHASKTCLQRK